MKLYLWGNICNNHFNFLRMLRETTDVEAELFFHVDEGFLPENDCQGVLDYSRWCHRSTESFTNLFLFPGKIIDKMASADINQVSGRYVIPAHRAFLKWGTPYIFHPYGDDFCNLPFGNGGCFSYRGIWSPIGRYLAAKTRRAIRQCPAFTIRYRDRRYAAAFKRLGIKPDDPRIRPIATPVDLDVFTQTESIMDRNFVVFMPSRIVWKLGKWDNKGSDLLFKGFARFRKSHPDHAIRLVAVRKGPDVGAAARLVTELGIEPDVLWLDEMPRESLIRHYQKADAVIDSLDRDGGAYGLVTVEGLACGKPVLVHLCRQVVSDAGSPPVFNIADDRETAAALERIFSGGWNRSGQGRRWAEENYAYRSVSARYTPLLEKLSGKRVGIRHG